MDSDLEYRPKNLIKWLNFKTINRDWYFLITACTLWIIAITISIKEFIMMLIHERTYNFEIPNVIGVALITIGYVIRRIARKTLGKYYSHALRILKDHKLIKHGIYKYIRHPAYLGAILIWLGIPLTLSSAHGLILMTLLIPCYIYRIKIEEKLLIRKFGEEYINYMKTSKRLIPYIW